MLVFAATIIPAVASAGLRYHFESSAGGRVTMSGRVFVEGKRSRIEVTRGDRFLFRDGDVVLSPPGGSLYLLDPAQKTYSVLAIDQLFGGLRSAIGADGPFEIRILNPRFNLRDLGDAGRLVGYRVRRYAT
jgi:hypothetical protein